MVTTRGLTVAGKLTAGGATALVSSLLIVGAAAAQSEFEPGESVESLTQGIIASGYEEVACPHEDPMGTEFTVPTEPGDNNK